MTPSLCKQREHEFDAMVKRVCSDERKDFMKSLSRRMNRETLFSELEEAQLYVIPQQADEDEYAVLLDQFLVLGFSIDVRDRLIYKALSQLDETRRNIILMFYWLEMNDREIAEAIGYQQRNVNRIRHSTYRKLRELLENDYDIQKETTT